MSYNQPKFNASSFWGDNAITFLNSTIVSSPYGIFINSNNTIYVADRGNNRILVWLNDSINSMTIMSGNLSSPYGIFVSISDDIYIDNGYPNGRVDKWTMNTNNSIPVMHVGQACFGLFVDINDTLYCSMRDLHQVVTKPLNSTSNVLRMVAGTGCNGSYSNMLNNPYGIFVDINFDLYVADCGNNRIQLFPSGQLNGTTVPEIGPSGTTITLSCPILELFWMRTNIFILWILSIIVLLDQDQMVFGV